MPMMYSVMPISAVITCKVKQPVSRKKMDSMVPKPETVRFMKVSRFIIFVGTYMIRQTTRPTTTPIRISLVMKHTTTMTIMGTRKFQMLPSSS